MPDPDYEKLGVFYLGASVDAQGREGAPLLYESRDLCTHACILGMTGSGKTGLGVALIEEAAIDGIPAIVIDPKGDLANLALSFPGLSAAEFLPWVDPDAARRAGRSPEAHAAAEALGWKDGLARSRQDGARIGRYRAAAEVAVYTPGSDAGRPLAVLAALAAPPAAAGADLEVLQARCDAAVASLLALVGIDADPLASREHILLATLLLRAWGAGRDVDLAVLVAEVQTPPLERVGVLPLEQFMPAKERTALALRLNNLLASPAFAAWIEGEPLDIDRLLFDPAGRARVAVVSIAHLGERERMFVVSLLLGQLLGWMRAQSGTASLRALLYMDEIAGYLPPVAAPPSKAPLMTLLKQARAFGLGVVLASQNPADLDYKALANIGTWLVGRLQTERDRAKVQAALEGVPGSDASELAAALGRLAPRTFLLHDVHAAAPLVFRSRWCLSYLRGPLTRELLAALRDRGAGVAPAPPRTTGGTPVPPPSAPRPLLPPDLPQLFVPLRGAGAPGYAPFALAVVRIGFSDARSGTRVDRDLVLAAPIPPAPAPVDWLAAEELDLAESELEREPEAGAGFAALPAAVTAKALEAWRKACADACYRTRRQELWRCPALKLASRPGEDERAFRLRAAQAAREARDAAVARLRSSYEPKLAALEERLRRARASEEKERAQARSAQVDSFFSIGGAILGALMGRKAMSAANVGRAASGARSLGRAAREQGDVGRAHDTVAAVQAQLDELEARFQQESTAEAPDPAALVLEPTALLPRKTDIAVRLVALGWRA
jgi:hypothetical protein